MNPLFDFIGGLASTIIPGLFGQGMNTAGNLALQKQAQNENIRQWDMQNKYNSPVAQMERLKQAGLNPNLVYGHGAVNQAGAIPSVSPAGDVDVLGQLGKYTAVKATSAQMQNTIAQNELIKAQAVKTKTEADIMAWNLDAARQASGPQGKVKVGEGYLGQIISQGLNAVPSFFDNLGNVGKNLFDFIGDKNNGTGLIGAWRRSRDLKWKQQFKKPWR